MATNIAVGMMDSAYFVGRKVILDWLNDLCALNLSKIEETASGAVTCQVFDALFPGVVPMQKVNWGAKVDYEFIQNYKVLQNVFNKLKVDKKIEVDRLIRGRYQDNLEFMQWLRKFAEINAPHDIDEYDAITAREKGKGFKQFKPANGGAALKKKKTKTSQPGTRRKPASGNQKENSPALNKSASSPGLPPTTTNASSKAIAQLEAKIKAIEKEKEDVNQEMTGLERERDFYFNKLREVEILLQNYDGPDESLVRKVLCVLYAADDDVDGQAAQAAVDAAMKASKEAREAAATAEQEETQAAEQQQEDEPSDVVETKDEETKDDEEPNQDE